MDGVVDQWSLIWFWIIPPISKHTHTKQLGGNPEPNEIIATGIVAVSAAAILFSFCMFGESLANQFDELDLRFYQSIDWYLFPMGIQRMLVTVMSNTQRPTVILGYGNVECTRDTFKTVIWAIFCMTEMHFWCRKLNRIRVHTFSD